MSALHVQWMDLDGPTDVMAFDGRAEERAERATIRFARRGAFDAGGDAR